MTFLLRKMDEDDEEEAYDFVPDVSEECRRYMDTFHVESNSSAIEHGKQRFHAWVFFFCVRNRRVLAQYEKPRTRQT